MLALGPRRLVPPAPTFARTQKKVGLAQLARPPAHTPSRRPSDGSELGSFRLAPPPPLAHGKTVRKTVPPGTKALLDHGDAAIARVRRDVPLGAGNTVYDLMKSRGRSFEVMAYTRDCHYPWRPSSSARDLVGRTAARVRAGRGGNCGEHAEAAAAALNELLPAGTLINLCGVEGLDHGFVVLGRLERNRVGLKEQVVVDAWLPGGQALLGEDFKFFDRRGPLAVKYSFPADGRDIVSDRVPRVTNAEGQPAAQHEAPRLSDGMRIKTWSDTHATRDNLRFVYEDDAAVKPAS